MHWAVLQGRVKVDGDKLTYQGREEKYEDGNPKPSLGQALCDQQFSGGEISATITFHGVSDTSACDIMFWYDPVERTFVNAGLATHALYGIRHFNRGWTTHALAGDENAIESDRPYNVRLWYRGSRAALFHDDVEVAAANLPFSLAPSQVGLWFRGTTDITVKNYRVDSEKPRAFVVMQFGSPYNELHREVLRIVCDEFGLDAVRADDSFSPGLIIADIVRQIQDSKVVIAELSEKNPNVFYEVGFAHAIGKPTILLAERSTLDKLPFDVSPFRTLFYDNTIEGKGRLESGLRKHLQAALDQSSYIAKGQPLRG